MKQFPHKRIFSLSFPLTIIFAACLLTLKPHQTKAQNIPCTDSTTSGTTITRCIGTMGNHYSRLTRSLTGNHDIYATLEMNAYIQGITLSHTGSGDTQVTSLKDSFIESDQNAALLITQRGTGAVIVNHGGRLISLSSFGISVNSTRINSGMIDITTQEDSVIQGSIVSTISLTTVSSSNGIIVKHNGSISLLSGQAIEAAIDNVSGTGDINITIQEEGKIATKGRGMDVTHQGVGDIIFNIQGLVESEQHGIYAKMTNTASTGNISINIEEKGTLEVKKSDSDGYFNDVTAVAYAIYIENDGTGNVSVVNHGAIRGTVYIQGDYSAEQGASLYPILPFSAPEAVASLPHGGDVAEGDIIGKSIILGDVTGTTFVRVSKDLEESLIRDLSNLGDEMVMIDVQPEKSKKDSFVLDGRSVIQAGSRTAFDIDLLMYNFIFDEANGDYLLRSELGTKPHTLKAMADVIHHMWNDVTIAWSHQLKSVGADREDLWVIASHNVGTRDMPTILGVADNQEKVTLSYDQDNSFIISGTKRIYRDIIDYGLVFAFSSAEVRFEINKDIYYHRAVAFGAHLAYKKDDSFIQMLGRLDIGDISNKTDSEKGFVAGELFSFGTHIDAGTSAIKKEYFDLVLLMGANVSFVSIFNAETSLTREQFLDFDDSNLATAYVGFDLDILKPLRVKQYLINAKISARAGRTILGSNGVSARVGEQTTNLDTVKLYGSRYIDGAAEFSIENELSGTFFYARFGAKSSSDMESNSIQLGLQKAF